MHFLCRRLATILRVQPGNKTCNNNDNNNATYAGVCVCVRVCVSDILRSTHTHTHTHSLFTCEFIAAINEYVCSNKPIFYVQKSREKLFSTVKLAG